MIIKRNKEVDINKWKDLLTLSEFASPFQTPEFYEFFNSVDVFSADVFAVEENNKYLALVVVTIQKERGVKSYFSKRGIIYGGPLSVDENSFSLLLLAVNKHYKRSLIYLEVRNNFDYSNLLRTYEMQGWKYVEHLNVQLPIENTTIDSILSKMKYNRRREIKLSYKEGAIVRQADSEIEVVLLYNILKELYDTRVKLPLPSLSYFINFFNYKIGKVFIVIHDSKVIGGSFCVFYEKMTINTLYYAGLRNYHKKIFPTHLAIMGVIKFAINKNLRMIDFMGAGKPNEKYGVRDFKLQFGGKLVEHGRYINILNPFLYKTGVLGLKLLSKLKK